MNLAGTRILSPLALLFDRDDEAARERRLAERARLADEPGRWWRCAACGRAVCRREARTERAGSHRHRCRNPAGVEFEIGCFDSADGCRPIGDRTERHTWFPGYAWHVALCAGCGAQLGWQFACADDRFFGLILERIVLSG